MKKPKHIAFIVDGNRRWAKRKGLSPFAGHRKVTDEVLEKLIFRAIELKIPYITFWAFSTENWKRGEKFSKGLFNIMGKAMQKNIDKYHQAGIRLNTIGDLSKLPENLVKTIKKWEKQSKDNKKITVTIALNYGGRDEILRAIRRAGSRFKVQGLRFTEEKFSSCLDTHNLPDPDLIIRTGGAKRLSGFMLWQSEYAELYFSDVLMPDFGVEEFDRAVDEFGRRKRRFGK